VVAFTAHRGEGPGVRRGVPTFVASCSALAACSILGACAHRVAPQAPGADREAQSASHQAAELTPEIVLARVRDGYTIGVQRCYTRYLKNRSGHGRVLVSFTVDERGRA